MKNKEPEFTECGQDIRKTRVVLFDKFHKTNEKVITDSHFKKRFNFCLDILDKSIPNYYYIPKEKTSQNQPSQTNTK